MLKMKLSQHFLAALVLCAALPFSASAQTKDPIKVGAVSSQSGTFAQQGEEVLRAIQFAVDEANEANNARTIACPLSG